LTPTAGRPTRTPAPTPTLPPIPELACIPADGERVSAIVVGVTDGDTIDVSIGGLRFRVRYLGIDTPETRSPDAGTERMGKEAFNRNLELVRGERVTLINDPNDNDTDPFGRLLRYVVTEDTFVNYRLVREGFSFLYFSGIACGPTLFEAYELAQSEQLGLFAPTPVP
jgi:micrococcal nuclease